MSAARILYPPLSGRDRHHHSAQLRKAENELRRLTREATAAHEGADRQLAEAHRLDCLAWTARQFTGGPEAPSQRRLPGSVKSTCAHSGAPQTPR